MLFWLVAIVGVVLPPLMLPLVESFVLLVVLAVLPLFDTSPTATLPLFADEVPAPSPVLFASVVDVLREFWSPMALLPLTAADVPAPTPVSVLELVGMVCAIAVEAAKRAAADVVRRKLFLIWYSLALSMVGRATRECKVTGPVPIGQTVN